MIRNTSGYQRPPENDDSGSDGDDSGRKQVVPGILSAAKIIVRFGHPSPDLSQVIDATYQLLQKNAFENATQLLQNTIEVRDSTALPGLSLAYAWVFMVALFVGLFVGSIGFCCVGAGSHGPPAAVGLFSVLCHFVAQLLTAIQLSRNNANPYAPTTDMDLGSGIVSLLGWGSAALSGFMAIWVVHCGNPAPRPVRRSIPLTEQKPSSSRQPSRNDQVEITVPPARRSSPRWK